jgi:phosphatidylethanolamine-binding protein (PEBP) family uncharacterized protein
MNQPNVKIPASALQEADNNSKSSATDLAPTRFAVFMIDIDVVANGTATTLLQWYQSDLIPQGQPLPLGNTSHAQTLARTVNEAIALSSDKHVTSQDVDMSPSQDNQISENSQPRIVAPYLPPSPPPGTPHRYVLLLFAQLPNYTFPSCYSDISSSASLLGDNTITINVRARLGFDVSEFARVAGLQPNPVAGNFFRVGTDIGPAKRKAIQAWEAKRHKLVKRQHQRTALDASAVATRSLNRVNCVATAAPTSKEPVVATTIFVTATQTLTATETTTKTKTVANQTILVTASAKARS